MKQLILFAIRLVAIFISALFFMLVWNWGLEVSDISYPTAVIVVALVGISTAPWMQVKLDA